ncbi:hypothetical protein ACFOEE_12210 [Pseudoalteromonas fenneropenaei]|uniref:ParB/Sulfiredoxin domain-containing protein n=1 Tax=Pseudoalteromonas fenneropenaei TaxID=1737459 RepID=A0ABV7CKW3_9GAMM
MVKPVTLNVLDIYLDQKNPRHAPLNAQSDIVEKLIQKEQVKQLARDIAENGVSPLEMTAVIKDESGRFIVVEGNRRTCALRLLNDPKSAPNTHVSYFTKLAKNSEKIPKKITCQLFDSREDADIWIERRHSGTQDGIGAKQWNSDQKTRFNTSREKRDDNALASAILDFAVLQGFVPEEREDKILTTAARFLGNPFFRKTLGIISSRSHAYVELNVPLNEFAIVIEKFCKDLLDPKSEVTSRTKKVQWEAYARTLISLGLAPKNHVQSYLLSDVLNSSESDSSEAEGVTQNQGENPPIDSKASPSSKFESNSNDHANDTSSGEGGKKEESTTRHQNTKNPDKRKYIIPYGFSASIKNPILRRVYQEMTEILIDDNTLAVSLLTRAFLENLYSLFHEKELGNQIKAQTHVVMNKVITHIEKNTNLTKVESQALGALKRVQCNHNNVLSPHTLGANAHASHYPNATELKREWDNISAIVEYMLKRI